MLLPKKFLAGLFVLEALFLSVGILEDNPVKIFLSMFVMAGIYFNLLFGWYLD